MMESRGENNFIRRCDQKVKNLICQQNCEQFERLGMRKLVSISDQSLINGLDSRRQQSGGQDGVL